MCDPVMGEIEVAPTKRTKLAQVATTRDHVRAETSGPREMLLETERTSVKRRREEIVDDLPRKSSVKVNSGRVPQAVGQVITGVLHNNTNMPPLNVVIIADSWRSSSWLPVADGMSSWRVVGFYSNDSQLPPELAHLNLRPITGAETVEPEVLILDGRSGIKECPLLGSLARTAIGLVSTEPRMMTSEWR